MVYRLPAALHLAVEVALTTGRPLLLRGARAPASRHWRLHRAPPRLALYEYVVTSTSTANDLLWRFDAVKRLADAQARKAKAEAKYVDPGVLWWALDRRSAAASPGARVARSRTPPQQGARPASGGRPDRRDRQGAPRPAEQPAGRARLEPDLGAVPRRPIEIDPARAKPLKLPKDVHVSPVQVVITTNEERELPAAFVRRCVTYALQHPKGDGLVDIARAQFDRKEAPFTKADEALARPSASGSTSCAPRPRSATTSRARPSSWTRSGLAGSAKSRPTRPIRDGR